jgi:oligopeptide transport system ATP-binding protein
MSHLLEVNNLVTRFYSDGATIHAVNGISYTLDAGESLAIVGESGSGKSVGVMSFMGLIRFPSGRVEGGEVLFKGRDLLKLKPDEMRKVRGSEIAMIFQDPMTSLNPVLPVGLATDGAAAGAHGQMDKPRLAPAPPSCSRWWGCPTPPTG